MITTQNLIICMFLFAIGLIYSATERSWGFGIVCIIALFLCGFTLAVRLLGAL
jgi:hypothetical protein